MTKVAAMVAMLLGAAPVLAQVTDIPIAADKLSMSRTGPHKAWLVFVSHDPQLVFPGQRRRTLPARQSRFRPWETRRSPALAL
jgi:hypothetical protein